MHLQSGQRVTPLDAWSLLGIYRLSARIHELKKDGWCISSKSVSVENRFGESILVSEYSLGENKND
jgi:hypothetical protein